MEANPADYSYIKIIMKSTLIKQIFLLLFSLLAVLPRLSAQSKRVGKDQLLSEKKQSNFSGIVSVKMFTDPKNLLNCTIGSISFEAGARTNWHKHPGGQILMITEGTAFYQERGSRKRSIRKGEVVSCLPNVEHWHGASTTGPMTHLAVGPNTDRGAVTWLEKVEDKVYLK